MSNRNDKLARVLLAVLVRLSLIHSRIDSICAIRTTLSDGEHEFRFSRFQRAMWAGEVGFDPWSPEMKMFNVWIDPARAADESGLGLRARISNAHQMARQILFRPLLNKAPDTSVDAIKLILVQYLALCSGPKVLNLFVRIGRTRSFEELFRLRIACYEEVARQHHQSLAQEMVDFVDSALIMPSQQRGESPGKACPAWWQKSLQKPEGVPERH